MPSLEISSALQVRTISACDLHPWDFSPHPINTNDNTINVINLIPIPFGMTYYSTLCHTNTLNYDKIILRQGRNYRYLGRNMAKQEEKNIENGIIEYLNMRGHFAFPYENTATYDPKIKGFRKFNSKTKQAGVSDIICLTKWAKMVVFEVKTPTIKLRIDRNLNKWLEKRATGYKYSKEITHFLEQYDFICKIKENGGHGYFVSGIGDVANLGY